MRRTPPIRRLVAERDTRVLVRGDAPPADGGLPADGALPADTGGSGRCRRTRRFAVRAPRRVVPREDASRTTNLPGPLTPVSHGTNVRIVDEDTVSDTMTDDPAGGRRAGSLLTSTQKTLTVLEAMAGEAQPVGVSYLARLVGSSRGTVHKQLATLVASGWVEQHPDGRYGLSLVLARIGVAALNQAGLGEQIQRVLEGLVAVTGETASVGILDHDSALIIQRAESGQVLNADIRVGTRIPLTMGATTLVLLAFATTREQRDEVRSRGVSVADEERIARVAEAGVAHTVDDFVRGLCAVSVPFRDGINFRTMALTVAGPVGRVDVDSATNALQAARERINALGRAGAPTLQEVSAH